MSGETPDWRRLNVTSQSFPVTDLGEVAARLDSPVVFDRRGDVFDLTTFEYGLGGWRGLSSGDGSSTELTRTYARRGNYAVHLVTGTTSAMSAQITKDVGLQALGRFGFHAAVARRLPLTSIGLWAEHKDGLRDYYYAVQWLPATGELQVRNAAGAFVTVATSGIVPATQPTWVDLKMVIDLDTKRYERGLLGRAQVDLSGYTAQDLAAATTESLTLWVIATGDAGANRNGYVDAVVLTVNEPPNAG